MAIVSTTKMKMGPGGQEFIRKVKCDSRGTFECDLPPLVAKHSDTTTATGDTLDACLSAWNAAVNKFFAGKREESRVIIYKYSRAPEKYSFNKCPDLFFEFYACACVETKISDASGAISYVYEDPERDMYGDEDESSRWEMAIPDSIRDRGLKPHRIVTERPEQIIPYSQEAVSFFVQMDTIMNKLKDRLDEILKSPSDLMKFTSGGTLLLSDSRTKGTGG